MVAGVRGLDGVVANIAGGAESEWSERSDVNDSWTCED
jgi:hypothetical protein